jgi:hypothetical protein
MGRFAKMDPMDVPEVLAGTGVEISIGKENADGSKMKFEVQRFFDKLCPSELGRNPRQKHPKMSKDIHGINSLTISLTISGDGHARHSDWSTRHV